MVSIEYREWLKKCMKIRQDEKKCITSSTALAAQVVMKNLVELIWQSKELDKQMLLSIALDDYKDSLCLY